MKILLAELALLILAAHHLLAAAQIVGTAIAPVCLCVGVCVRGYRRLLIVDFISVRSRHFATDLSVERPLATELSARRATSLLGQRAAHPARSLFRRNQYQN